MTVYFDHEKLIAYQKAVEFVRWSNDIIRKFHRMYAVIDQFDRASTSIALNIAEGNGKYLSKDRCRYFDIARGSSYETSACLDILYAKGIINDQDLKCGKEMLVEIVSMTVGLIKRNSDRTFEPDPEYNSD